MNEIKKIFSDLSMEYLIKAINEMKEHDKTGIIPGESCLKETARKVQEITGDNLSTLLIVTRMNLLTEFSYRMTDSFKEQETYKEYNDFQQKIERIRSRK